MKPNIKRKLKINPSRDYLNGCYRVPLRNKQPSNFFKGGKKCRVWHRQFKRGLKNIYKMSILIEYNIKLRR